jgi:ABC-type antimicrobial peptide transport system permease subunit
LLLAVIGLYATMAYSVSKRTRELGARLAMGASQRDVLRLVLTQALGLAVIGLGIGVVVAAAVTRIYSSLLVGVHPLDLATFLAVSLLLGAVAVVASYVPARRASKLDPLQALRHE